MLIIIAIATILNVALLLGSMCRLFSIERELDSLHDSVTQIIEDLYEPDPGGGTPPQEPIKSAMILPFKRAS